MEALHGMNRREFVQRSAAGALAAGFAASIPRRVFGDDDRIRCAVIGVGGRGSGLLGDLITRTRGDSPRVSVTAVCDVWDKRRNEAADRADAPGYVDYRDILSRDDVDAVVIGTPDHWHARMSIDAMRAGKDVYCEKPMTLTWQEAKDVARVQKETGRVYQCGAQSASGDSFWQARRIIRDGGIGKLIWSQAGYCRNSPEGDWNYGIDPTANPGNLDWDLWLGPAPKRPWSPERYFRFRKYWDYSGGVATDLLYHALTHTEVSLGEEFPIEVMATGGNYVHKEREVPDTFHVLIRYPSNHTVFLVSTQANDESPGDLIRGQHATIHFRGPGIEIVPETQFLDRIEERVQAGMYRHGQVSRDEKGNIQSIVIPSVKREDHLDNFLTCVKTGEKPTLDAQAAYKVMVAISLSVQSYREKRLMRFDPVREEEIQA